MIEVVSALPDDAPALRQITLQSKAYWGYEPAWTAAWAEIFHLPAEYVRSHIAFKAVENGEVLGWYALQSGDAAWMLDHLWVVPDRIGQGLGRRLFRHAVEQARAGGARRLQWEADPHAVAFYQHMGGRVTGEVISDMGRAIPVMSLDLEAG